MTTTPSPTDTAVPPVAHAGWRHGVVAWFNAEKGFGFIEPNDRSGPVFVEYTSIQTSGYKTLASGQPVVFTTNNHPRGPETDRVHPLADADNSDTNRIDQPDVYWPDPSPLQRWWTEVMEGAAIPRTRTAA